MLVHTDLRLHSAIFSPPRTLHCPSVLAFSSKDKGSWRLACWDLIAGAHFTLPKPGLIHLSTPVPLLTETCFCLHCSPACVFFSSSVLKRKKSGMRELRERGKYFSSPASLISLFKGLTMCYANMFPCFFPYSSLPGGYSTYLSANTFYSDTNHKSSLNCKENTDVGTLVA